MKIKYVKRYCPSKTKFNNMLMNNNVSEKHILVLDDYELTSTKIFLQRDPKSQIYVVERDKDVYRKQLEVKEELNLNISIYRMQLAKFLMKYKNIVKLVNIAYLDFTGTIRTTKKDINALLLLTKNIIFATTTCLRDSKYIHDSTTYTKEDLREIKSRYPKFTSCKQLAQIRGTIHKIFMLNDYKIITYYDKYYGTEYTTKNKRELMRYMYFNMIIAEKV